MSFATPLALAGLALVPLVLAGYLFHQWRRARYAERFARRALLPGVIDRAPGWRRHVPFALFLLALSALLVGVARPHAIVSTPREEATVILALDVSGSMGAKDVAPTRLAAARNAAGVFLEQVPEKFRVGIVSFADRAQVALPPTQNREAARDALAALSLGEGTAIGDAIALTLDLGRGLRAGQTGDEAPPVAVLLLSDGAQTVGRLTPPAAAARARALRIPVYTVALGTDAGVVERELLGGYREIIRVPPDPETLRRVARATRAEFFSAPDSEQLSQVYEELGSRLGERREEREVSDLFAAAGGGLLVVGGALSALWFRRLP